MLRANVPGHDLEVYLDDSIVLCEFLSACASERAELRRLGQLATPSPVPAVMGPPWRGFREYVSPKGEPFFWLQNLNYAADGGAGGNSPDVPHTETKPGTDTPAAAPPQHRNRPVIFDGPWDEPPGSDPPKTQDGGNPNPNPPQPPDPGDIDAELKRQHDWLRHRFDATTSRPGPDPSQDGTYKRMLDELEKTRERIRALDHKPDDQVVTWGEWVWGDGRQIHMLLTHARSIGWQIEEFERAYRNGDDPVAAVNAYNRQQWEDFLRTMEKHLKLMGDAIVDIELLRALLNAVERAVVRTQAARTKWLKAGNRPPIGSPAVGGVPPTRERRIGGLTATEWERFRLRRNTNKLPQFSEAEKAANAIYKARFPSVVGADEARYGQFGGWIAISQDGKSALVSTFELTPDGQLIGPTLSPVPVSEIPVDVSDLPLGTFDPTIGGFDWTLSAPR
jgi:hypothetical protein